MEMKHTEKELQALKEEVSHMWKLVLSQLEKVKQAFLNGEVELAREIVSREKRVDAFELKIDSDCENYIALYSPVAVDLRLVLSLIISITLERIGDFAESIARHVIDREGCIPESQIVEELQIENYRTSFDILTRYLQENPDRIRCGLKTILILRKLERIGDHCNNIVEEIVFLRRRQSPEARRKILTRRKLFQSCK
jgi:phosphate transport system protein